MCDGVMAGTLYRPPRGESAKSLFGGAENE
jgi:hypothetical protein